MKSVEVEIVGKTPLLMNNPIVMMEQSDEMRNKLKKIDPTEEADKSAYKMEDGTLYIPSEAIFGCILNGASFRKIGKFAAKGILAGNLRIEPNQISLGTKEYEADLRTVAVGGRKSMRILKGRAKVNQWKAKFKIVYFEDYISSPKDHILPALEDGGRRVGILAFRPQNSGNFGTFVVNKFKVENNGRKNDKN